MSEITTRAEEGAKEPGQVAYEARYVGVWRDVIAPWRDIGDGQRSAWVYVEKTIAARAEARAVSAEAAVADLRKSLAACMADLERGGLSKRVYANAAIGAELEAAEASASALRDRVAVLESALRLCFAELDLQADLTDRCGQYGTECPLQDIHKPNDSHAEARAAARAALNGGDHV